MQSDYIKKLEEANALLEQEMFKLQKKLGNYQAVRNHLFAAIYACRTLLYEYTLYSKDSPKREENADRELEFILKQITEFAEKMTPGGAIGTGDLYSDVSLGGPLGYNTFDIIRKFITEAEKKIPIDTYRDVV